MAINYVLAILLLTVTATAITTITNVSSPEKENNPFIYEHETILYNQDYVFIYDYPYDKALIIIVLDGSLDLRTNNSSIENNSYFSGTGSYRKILVLFQVLWVPWFFLVDGFNNNDDDDDDDDDEDFDDGDDENGDDDSKEEEAGDDDGYDSYEDEKRRWEEEERRWREDMKKRDEEDEDFERKMELDEMYDKQLDEEYYELLKWEYDDGFYDDDENDMINYIQGL